MENQYKEEMNRIHAPEALIRKTQTLIRKHGKQERNRYLLLRRGAVIVAAACIFLIGIMVLRVNSLVNFTKAEQMQMEQTPKLLLGLRDPERRNITADEFDQAFDTGFSSLSIDQVRAYLIRTPDGEPESGELSFEWNTEKANLQVQCAVAIEADFLFPTLLTAKKEEVKGVKVSFVRTESCYYAAVFGEESTMMVSQKDADGGLMSRYAFRRSVSELVERLKYR